MCCCCSEWCKQVFVGIQSQVQSGLDSRSVSEIEARRAELFEQYLHSRRSARGTSSSSTSTLGSSRTADYEPLRGRSSSLRYSAAAHVIRDPVKRDIHKFENEAKLVSSLTARVHSVFVSLFICLLCRNPSDRAIATYWTSRCGLSLTLLPTDATRRCFPPTASPRACH